jgi:hypothetical protein
MRTRGRSGGFARAAIWSKFGFAAGAPLMRTALSKFVIFCAVVALIGTATASRATAGPSDFDGVWIPDVKDQHRQETENAL